MVCLNPKPEPILIPLVCIRPLGCIRACFSKNNRKWCFQFSAKNNSGKYYIALINSQLHQEVLFPISLNLLYKKQNFEFPLLSLCPLFHSLDFVLHKPDLISCFTGLLLLIHPLLANLLFTNLFIFTAKFEIHFMSPTCQII